jgi:hypothetical protein
LALAYCARTSTHHMDPLVGSALFSSVVLVVPEPALLGVASAPAMPLGVIDSSMMHQSQDVMVTTL